MFATPHSFLNLPKEVHWRLSSNYLTTEDLVNLSQTCTLLQQTYKKESLKNVLYVPHFLLNEGPFYDPAKYRIRVLPYESFFQPSKYQWITTEDIFFATFWNWSFYSDHLSLNDCEKLEGLSARYAESKNSSALSEKYPNLTQVTCKVTATEPRTQVHLKLNVTFERLKTNLLLTLDAFNTHHQLYYGMNDAYFFSGMLRYTPSFNDQLQKLTLLNINFSHYSGNGSLDGYSSCPIILEHDLEYMKNLQTFIFYPSFSIVLSMYGKIIEKAMNHLTQLKVLETGHNLCTYSREHLPFNVTHSSFSTSMDIIGAYVKPGRLLECKITLMIIQEDEKNVKSRLTPSQVQEFMDFENYKWIGFESEIYLPQVTHLYICDPEKCTRRKLGYKDVVFKNLNMLRLPNLRYFKEEMKVIDYSTVLMGSTNDKNYHYHHSSSEFSDLSLPQINNLTYLEISTNKSECLFRFFSEMKNLSNLKTLKFNDSVTPIYYFLKSSMIICDDKITDDENSWLCSIISQVCFICVAFKQHKLMVMKKTTRNEDKQEKIIFSEIVDELFRVINDCIPYIQSLKSGYDNYFDRVNYDKSIKPWYDFLEMCWDPVSYFETIGKSKLSFLSGFLDECHPKKKNGKEEEDHKGILKNNPKLMNIAVFLSFWEYFYTSITCLKNLETLVVQEFEGDKHLWPYDTCNSLLRNARVEAGNGCFYSYIFQTPALMGLILNIETENPITKLYSSSNNLKLLKFPLPDNDKEYKWDFGMNTNYHLHRETFSNDDEDNGQAIKYLKFTELVIEKIWNANDDDDDKESISEYSNLVTAEGVSYKRITRALNEQEEEEENKEMFDNFFYFHGNSVATSLWTMENKSQGIINIPLVRSEYKNYKLKL